MNSSEEQAKIDEADALIDSNRDLTRPERLLLFASRGEGAFPDPESWEYAETLSEMGYLEEGVPQPGLRWFEVTLAGQLLVTHYILTRSLANMIEFTIPIKAVMKRATGITQRPNASLASTQIEEGLAFNLRVAPDEMIRMNLGVKEAELLRRHLGTPALQVIWKLARELREKVDKATANAPGYGDAQGEVAIMWAEAFGDLEEALEKAVSKS